IGMGKSTSADFFAARGVKVIDTDQIARELVEPGQPALGEIQTVFGSDIVAADGRLKRDELAARVFAKPHERQRLEAILHPRIRGACLTMPSPSTPVRATVRFTAIRSPTPLRRPCRMRLWFISV